MSVHDVCALYARGCLRSISSVSPWYPLVGIPIGIHSPHSARLGHPSPLKIGTLAIPLPAFNLSKERLTRGHFVKIVWQLEAQKKRAFVIVVSVQAKPRQKGDSAGHTLDV